jgi:hypothetical protein
VIPLALRALPWVIRARVALRRTRDLHRLLADHDIEPRAARSRHVPADSLRRGVDAALRLVGPRQDACVPRSLALFALLSRHGYPAVFVSGVRLVGSGLVGHAWVLVDELPLEAPDARKLLATFREQLRFANQRQRQLST